MSLALSHIPFCKIPVNALMDFFFLSRYLHNRFSWSLPCLFPEMFQWDVKLNAKYPNTVFSRLFYVKHVKMSVIVVLINCSNFHFQIKMFTMSCQPAVQNIFMGWWILLRYCFLTVVVMRQQKGHVLGVWPGHIHDTKKCLFFACNAAGNMWWRSVSIPFLCIINFLKMCFCTVRVHTN